MAISKYLLSAYSSVCQLIALKHSFLMLLNETSLGLCKKDYTKLLP